ncbi:MAG: 4-hydroxy-tetrahydrodipicolinate reductase [Bacteroidia bacterium]|nr:4-hydroxy-tetrahydrodipicolinate reductase [Bacteroidia bacterium]
MNIALIGYGKMGKSIEMMALNQGHQIVAKIDSDDFTSADLLNADVAIEFSQPNVAVENIKKCFEAQIPVVVGTTGWYDQYDKICKLAKETDQTLFTATNFSIGVNIVFNINQKLAEIMNQFPEYDVHMTEVHHLEKKDHPSGTASTLADDIVNAIDRKTGYVGRIDKPYTTKTALDLHINCQRGKNVPGYHQVTYTSEIDEISIQHNAKNREGFTKGAIIAAEWIIGKKGVFTMKDLLKF